LLVLGSQETTVKGCIVDLALQVKCFRIENVDLSLILTNKEVFCIDESIIFLFNFPLARLRLISCIP